MGENKVEQRMPRDLEDIRVKVALTIVRGKWSGQKLIGERHETFVGLMRADEVPARVDVMWAETKADVLARFRTLVGGGERP